LLQRYTWAIQRYRGSFQALRLRLLPCRPSMPTDTGPSIPSVKKSAAANHVNWCVSTTGAAADRGMARFRNRIQFAERQAAFTIPSGTAAWAGALARVPRLFERSGHSRTQCQTEAAQTTRGTGAPQAKKSARDDARRTVARIGSRPDRHVRSSRQLLPQPTQNALRLCVTPMNRSASRGCYTKRGLTCIACNGLQFYL
jgi:hypothetical protein